MTEQRNDRSRHTPSDTDDLRRLEGATPSRLARWIAGAFTPANVVVALMAYIAVKYSASLGQGLRWWLVALAMVIGVPYLILFGALRAGRVADRQIVRRSERPGLMAAAAVSVAAALGVLLWAGAPKPLVWLILAMLAGLTTMTLLTLRWKASMHLAVAAGAVVVLWIENHTYGAAAALLLPVLAWARWRDGRHSVGQLLVGAFVGVVTVAGVYAARGV